MEKPVRVKKGIATFVCPECGKEKTADVSKYRSELRLIKVGCKCPCGHGFSVFLDRREYERKNVTLTGTYILLYNGREMNRGPMMVMNISRTGLQMNVFKERQVEIGDRLIVKFNLDNEEKTPIQQEVIVRHFEDLLIGVEFFSPSHIDETLFL